MRHIASGIERLIGHAYDETDEKKGAPPPINRKRSAEQGGAANRPQIGLWLTFVFGQPDEEQTWPYSVKKS
jgi:hypothetical protein